MKSMALTDAELASLKKDMRSLIALHGLIADETSADQDALARVTSMRERILYAADCAIDAKIAYYGPDAAEAAASESPIKP